MGCLNKALFCLCVVAALGVVENTKVSVYYEVLCPDSVNFITNQLYPTYTSLKDKITVDFVPYGKAYQSLGPDGRWSFQCQHGFFECKGNKYHACVLDQNLGNDKAVSFVNCAMGLSDNSDEVAIGDCATANGYNWNKVEACYENGRGDNLLASYGDRTHRLSPKLSFVPTIIADDRYDSKFQRDSLYNFKAAICSKMPSPKPSECS